MKFRPCIDIHNGSVKQIVGSSLQGDSAKENFVSNVGADFYAKLYKKYSLKGGHIILLNASDSSYYEQDKQEAKKALTEYPDALQIGGGVNADNASWFIENGASHVVVTSYVFKNGRVDFNNLTSLVNAVGKEKLVLDLSCKKYEDGYYIVTDRWTKKTDVRVCTQTLTELSQYCSEILVHAVDVEGKCQGIDRELVSLLSKSPVTVTYAGGISSLEDIKALETAGKGRVDFTVGSALDIFGGKLSFEEIAVKYNR